MTVIPLPRHGHWAWDLRGEGRAVRVSTHPDEGLLNVSIWREGTCVGTARLLPADVATLVSGLTDGLAEIATAPRGGREEGTPERLHELEQRLAAVESRFGTTTRRSVAHRMVGATRSALATLRRRLGEVSATVFGDRARSTADRGHGRPHGG
jgi:hypothetical protein